MLARSRRGRGELLATSAAAAPFPGERKSRASARLFGPRNFWAGELSADPVPLVANEANEQNTTWPLVLPFRLCCFGPRRESARTPRSNAMPTGMAPEATRGVSDSAAALVASSINGGGCLPPPTPAEKIAETLGKHMERAVNPEPTNYRAALPDSLSWRTTTQTMMVGGLAGEVTEEELAKVPLDLTSGLACQEACAPAALCPGWAL